MMGCKKNCSLRARLLRLLALPMVLAMLAVGISSYYSALHEAEEVYDAQLVHLAKILLALTQHEVEEGDISEKQLMMQNQVQLTEYEKHIAYRVWLNNGLILHSGKANYYGPITQTAGFTERMIGKDRWRFFVMKHHEITIEVAERHEVRSDLIRHIIGGIFLPQLLIIPVFIAIVWFGVTWGVRPLDVISGLIRKRDPSRLEPVEAPVTPREIMPIIEAINDLMLRTRNALEHEKRFSNYAAHELRTPLAALKTQLQVALRTKDENKARSLFQETLPAINRMQHLVDQMLTFVRVQRSDSTFSSIDFSALCTAVASEMAALASTQQRHLSCDIKPNITLKGNDEMLQALVRNLLGNAIKYTHAEGQIVLTLTQHAESVVLKVADNGIGVDEAIRDKLCESFFRGASTHAEGSGLGLAIVKWVADAHNATLDIAQGDNQQGCVFTVTFSTNGQS